MRQFQIGLVSLVGLLIVAQLFVRAGGVGFVTYEDIVGRADRIMFSCAGRSFLQVWTWRSDRFFKAIE